MAENYGEKLAKGGLIVTLIFVIGAIAGYGLRIFVSRSLSIEEFGLFYSILSVVGAFSIFKELGLTSSLAVKMPEFLSSGHFGKANDIIKKSLLIQLLASVVIAVFILSFAAFLFPRLQETSSQVMKIIVFSFIASVLFEIFRAGLQGTKHFVFYSAIEPARLIIIFVSSFILFSMGMGIVGLAFSYLIAALLLSIIVPSYFFIKNKNIMKSHSIKVPTKEIAYFTGFIWFGSIASTVLAYADTIILALLKAPKEAGFYQVALPTAQLITFFLTPMTIVLLPFVSEMWNKKDKDVLNNTAGFVVKMLLVAILPAIIVLEVLSHDIILFIFGDKFIPAIPALQILIIGMLFYSFVPLLTTFILGIGRPKDNIKIMASMGAVNIILDLLLIPSLGIIGAAISLSLAYLVGTVVAFTMIKKSIKFTIQYKNIGKTLVGGVIVLVVITYLKEIIQLTPVPEAILLIVVAGILYSGYVLATKTVDKRDIQIIKNAKILPKCVSKILEKLAR